MTLAALLAVLMSSADTYLLVSDQTPVKDIRGEPWPVADDKTDLIVSRVFVVSLPVRGVYEALMYAWTFYASSWGIPALMALYWRMATRACMMAGIIAGFSTSITLKIIGSPYGMGSSIPGSIACGIVLVVVSIMTYNKIRETPFPEVK